jgi:hypothetical protein
MATLEKFINALHKNARSLTAPLRAICPLSKICTRAAPHSPANWSLDAFVEEYDGVPSA